MVPQELGSWMNDVGLLCLLEVSGVFSSRLCFNRMEALILLTVSGNNRQFPRKE